MKRNEMQLGQPLETQTDLSDPSARGMIADTVGNAMNALTAAWKSGEYGALCKNVSEDTMISHISPQALSALVRLDAIRTT